MGSKNPTTTVVQPPPPTITQLPPPNAQQTASDLFKAQLEFNPQLTQQAFDLQQQYGPLLAQLQTDTQLGQAPQLAQGQYDLQAQYGPMYRALYEQLFPTQTQGLEQVAQQGLQQMQSPTGLTAAQQGANDQALQQAYGQVSSQYADVLGPQAIQQYQNPIGLTPEQQQAQEAIRQRAFQQSERGIRNSANMGGGLFGGRRELREDRARNELAQGFAVEDIDRQAQQRQQALAQLLAASGMQQGIEQQRNVFGQQAIGNLQQQRASALQNVIAGGQVVFPQIQQPGVGNFQAPQFGQGVAASPDALLQAYMNSTFVQPAAIGFGQSPFSQNAALIAGLTQAGATAAAAGCHVAEVLYGVDDLRTHLARRYALTHDGFFLRLYRGFSDVWAGWVRKLPFLARLVRPIWDRMWHRQLAELRAV